jgi:hypothetical protein
LQQQACLTGLHQAKLFPSRESLDGHPLGLPSRDVILEVMLGFFVAITLLLVVMVRLEHTLDRTDPRGG